MSGWSLSPGKVIDDFVDPGHEEHIHIYIYIQKQHEYRETDA